LIAEHRGQKDVKLPLDRYEHPVQTTQQQVATSLAIPLDESA
jgi:hypothetical protein